VATPAAPWGLIVSRLDRIVFDIDTIPPTVPVLNVPTVIDTGRIDLSWSASTDTGGSGLAGYDILKDGTTTIALGIQLSYSDTGNAANSTHTYRVRAKDANNNLSGYSSQQSATTQAGTPPATNLQQDWINRSTANGVIWAHRFDDPATVEKFLGATDRPTARQFIFQNPGDGIFKDGCLEMRFPQGALPQYAWLRSIFPVTGDINKPGWPVLPLENYAHFHPEMFTNYQGGGHVVHSDYLAGSPGTSPPQAQTVRSSKIYIAYAVKFSASRMADIENTNPSGNGTGKYMMLTGWYANCSQEIVSQITTSYGGGWYNQYTNVGSNPNAFLRNPQDNGGNALIQPGGTHDATCFVNGPLPLGGQSSTNNQNCWTFPADQWVHILHVITPGRKAATLSGNWLNDPSNTPAKTTGIEVYYAYPGDASWTPITSYPSFIFDFAGDYLGVANGQPYGWSVLNFTPFNGGATSQPVMSPQGWSHKFDQMICSTQMPTVPIDNAIPTWYSAMTDKTWTRLLTHAQFLATAPTNPSVLSDSGVGIVVGAFNGAVVDQKRGAMLLAANGGHHDYAGNEVYECLLRANTPKWTRLTDRSPDNQINTSALQNNIYAKVSYADGMPPGMHTWNTPVFCEGLDKLAYPYTTDFSSGNSGQSPGGWFFDRGRCGDTYSAFPIPYATVASNAGIGAGYWQYMGLTLSSAGSMPSDYEACPGCWDPLNQEAMGFQKVPQSAPIAGESAWGIGKTGTITRYNVQPAAGNPVINWVACTYNTWPPLAVGNDVSSGDIYIWDLSKKATTRFVRKVPSGSNPASGAGWYGMWDAKSYAFLFYNQINGGTTVGKLKMNDPTNPVNSTWTYSTVAAAGGGQTPPAAGAQSYSKCQIVDMGSGRRALVSINDQGVWAYKIPAAGV